MTGQPVAQLSELQLRQPKRVEVGDTAICLVRTESGVHAVADACSHADVSLAEGDVDDLTIECWLHGSRFDLRTGQPSALPATQAVEVFPVTLDEDTVLVDIAAARPPR